ncbi:CD1107 family mobile element protein [Oribacterium parvum]|uniref:CD1107 family mobile element protein n=1 Tax=Oribacterium parvum TaxID=1501329 RepID=UPI0028DC2B64|nr:DUF4366 domain-containing protein [Oribacterium parvum]
MAMKTKKWRRLIVATVLSTMLTMHGFSVLSYAQVNEQEAAEESVTKEEENAETTVTQEVKEEIEREVRFPNKLEAKDPENGKQGSNEEKSTNKGIATLPGEARATVTEDVDNANNAYPIHHGNEAEANDQFSADARQFISFKTKSGKVFHLIINHDEQDQNVMLLTEVSEDDLLNMVEQKESKPAITKEDPEKEESKEEQKPKTMEENGSMGSYVLLIFVVVLVMAVAYYFKVVKKKEAEAVESLEEEDNFFSEAESSEETEGDMEAEDMDMVEAETEEIDMEDDEEEE